MNSVKNLWAGIAVLFAGLMLAGCSTDNSNDNKNKNTKDPLEGKLLILQAYGTGDATDGSVSHSFVELYNNTNKTVKLNGYSLQYSAGTKVADNATADGEWTVIDLSGKSIPAKSSFLILGEKKNLSGRHQIAANYGDIAATDMQLSNRAFKVALIHSTKKLTVQNPFDTGKGKTVAGYIDMVGAENDDTDQILGYEKTPARISKQVSVRRVSLTDTNDNNTDFESLDYRISGMTAEELDVWQPRNAAYGGWDPLQEPEVPQGPFVQAGTIDTLAKKLLILQAYGSSNDAQGASRSFVELYNTTDAAITLTGITLYYADGIATANAPADGDWKTIALTGDIPAKGSYLILGPDQGSTRASYNIEAGYGDINNNDFTLSNRAFKVAVIRNTDKLNKQNPFNMGAGGQKAAGYIDMLGAANSASDTILGFETLPARASASEAARRKDLKDTDNNSTDFIAARYNGMADNVFAVVHPRNSKAGAWDPFEEPKQLEPTDNTLLILQFGAATDGNISRSFVELYNTGDEAVTLTGYSLQYAAGFSTNSGNGAPDGNATTDGPWNKIDLTGTIQPLHSFLILGAAQTTAAADSPPALAFENNYGDMTPTGFNLNNRAVKIALMSNTILLTVQNPFDIDGDGTKADGYVDMVGAINTTGTDNINGYETAKITNLNKQAGQRRQTLDDTDNNAADFARATFASMVTKSGGAITAYTAEYEIMRPKNHTYGEWDPFPEPTSEPTDNTLLILQIGGATDGNISHSFVELYNNGDEAVTLTGYSLQYAEGTRETVAANRPNTATEDGEWQKINLTGTIPPHCSFLILGDEGVGQTASTNPALKLTSGSGDMNPAGFVISNRSFKVVLLKSTTLLTVQNPFNIGAGVKASGYVDMVGAMNTVGEDKINGYEANAITDLNKQTGQRRTSLDDTDDNAADFARATYSGATAANIAIWRPKNLAYGAWDPVTGEKE